MTLSGSISDPCVGSNCAHEAITTSPPKMPGLALSGSIVFTGSPPAPATPQAAQQGAPGQAPGGRNQPYRFHIEDAGMGQNVSAHTNAGPDGAGPVDRG